MSSLTVLTPDNVKNFDLSRAVINCSAPWCGPCRRIKPELETKAEFYKDHVKFYTLNIDDGFDSDSVVGSQIKKVTAIPIFLFFADGKYVKAIKGWNPETLDKYVSEVFGEPKNLEEQEELDEPESSGSDVVDNSMFSPGCQKDLITDSDESDDSLMSLSGSE